MDKLIKPGFSPIPNQEQYCLNPDHQFPTHLYIPPGQQYTHICSACGKASTVANPGISLSSLT